MRALLWLPLLLGAPVLAAAEPTPPPVQAPADEPRLAPPTPGHTVEWPDADEDAKDVAEGAVKVCEAVTFPLTLLPGVGSVISSIVDWACLIPAAFAVDYVGVHHGHRAASFWQALGALAAAKVARTAILIPAIGGAVLIGVVYSTAVTGALVAADAAYYIPVGATGLLTLLGASALGIYQLRKLTDRATFSCVYFGLTPSLTEEARAAAQQEAWLKPPLDPFSRAYGLMTVAAAADVERDWAFAIPVVGPVLKADARRQALREDMRRLGRDALGELPQDPAGMDFAIDATLGLEGWLEAGAHALLLAGGAIFVAGTVSGALAYQENKDVAQYAWLTGGLGTVGVFVAGGGVALVALREVPRVLRPIAVPWAFGFLPPEEAEVE